MKNLVQISFIISLLLVLSNCTEQQHQSDTTYMIEEILNIEDPTQAIIELDSKLNEISDYGANISLLTEGEKVVLFVENLEREINNGGFNQFFWNSSGDYAHETLNALKLIGANKTAEIVSQAYSEWPNENIPSDRLTRQNVHQDIEEKAEVTWNKCDNDFYKYEDDLISLLFNYVKTNQNDFK